ncbi:MAG TPA: PilZ domain-containing protein [Candidatus Limnocylindrales bacterium]|nr:PilZ domain-containing protein [Candidatus Limnocylindrales bacterium]
MAQPQSEKRSVRRFPLELPVSIKYVGDGRAALAAQTRDVSSRGVFMLVDSQMAEGSSIEFVMTLPPEVRLAPEIMLAAPLRVRCSGRVLRVEGKEREQGIAVSIERYDFVGEE